MSSLLLMVGLRLAGIEKSIACGAGLAVLVPAIPLIVYFLHQMDKERRTAEAQAVELAPARWRQGERAEVKPRCNCLL